MKTFKRFLIENNFETLKKKAKAEGIVLFLYTHETDIILDSIIIPKDKQKEGIGTDIMNQLIKIADKNNQRILVSPGQKDDRHGTTSQSRLIKFYKRFGFKLNKGRNIDFTISQLMFRNPNGM